MYLLRELIIEDAKRLKSVRDLLVEEEEEIRNITIPDGNNKKNTYASKMQSRIDSIREVYERIIRSLEENCSLLYTIAEYSGAVPVSKVCHNCKKEYIEGDKYCRYCGSPMGRAGYIMDEMDYIYGPPPVKRTHECKSCGFTWTTCKMVDEEAWCPKCGCNLGTGVHYVTLQASRLPDKL